jgi:hypothetical protein
MELMNSNKVQVSLQFLRMNLLMTFMNSDGMKTHTKSLKELLVLLQQDVLSLLSYLSENTLRIKIHNHKYSPSERIKII